MATTRNQKLTPCACRSFEFGEFDGSNEDAITYDTGCVENTKATFAQGHDAKLVGFLVRAELAGDGIALIDGGVMLMIDEAVPAAGKISDALAAKAQAQLDAGKARLAKKAAREAAKTARASAKKAAAPAAPVASEAPKPTTRQAMIKVGRWTYAATIEMGSQAGLATYKTKLGATKTLTSDQYSEV